MISQYSHDCWVLTHLQERQVDFALAGNSEVQISRRHDGQDLCRYYGGEACLDVIHLFARGQLLKAMAGVMLDVVMTIAESVYRDQCNGQGQHSTM